MTDEVFKQQKAVVDLVIASAHENVLKGWIDSTLDDYWFDLTMREANMQGLLEELEKVGVNTDSIRVMDYVNASLSQWSVSR